MSPQRRRFLRTSEVSDTTGIPVTTLKHWRNVGQGPPCRRLAGNRYYVGMDIDQDLRFRGLVF